MSLIYFYVRYLGSGTTEDPFRADMLYNPNVDGMAIYLASNFTCNDFAGSPTYTAIDLSQFKQFTLIGHNKHVAICRFEMDDIYAYTILSSFNNWPFISCSWEYSYDAFLEHLTQTKAFYIDFLNGIDDTFDENNIQDYINSLYFVDPIHLSIISWMNDIMNGGNTILPDMLIDEQFWNMTNFEIFFHQLELASHESDLIKALKAFEVFNINTALDCTLV
jgi:hypothetical protein